MAIIDGAQSAPHLEINVKKMDADFFAFSGHKMLAPTGIGALYGKKEILEDIPPFLFGGDMIGHVQVDQTSWNELPWKFEAGTPAIAEAIGLGAAVDYLSGIGMDEIHAWEQHITGYALEALSEVPGLTILGPSAAQKVGETAFTLSGIHPHDIAQILDQDGIAIRAGHHCAMPLHEKLGIPATSRASMYIYNSEQEIDLLIESIHRVQKVFGES